MVVKTGTGSGKSTILPPYILGLGYKKIIVTQPRRLPCQRICQRIEQTNGNNVVGYRLGGGISKNPSNDLIYMTDGLLKQIIYGNEKFLKDVEVIILDQVHEETKNISLIILLLSRIFDDYPHLKVILCSATVNQSLISLFDKKNKVERFQVEINTFKVTQHCIQNKSILELTNELSGSLKANEQMLVFFPSIAEVNLYQKTFLQKYKKNAYALYGNQKSKIQEDAMKNGQIIFSTSIAETSLTFEGLRYVVDSRKSRIQTYDLKKKMMISKEICSSQSSIKQRKGRLGRVRDGDYYYIKYNNTYQPVKHNLSQLDRIQLLNVSFQLFIKYENWQIVKQQLLRLNVHDPVQFNQKIQQAQKTLSGFQSLFFKSGSYQISNICKSQIAVFGNMGNVYFNLALYQSIIKNCYENMAAAISFIMFGLPIYPQIIYSGNKQTCSGDLEVAGKFILDIANKMKLRTIARSQLYMEYLKLPQSKKNAGMNNILIKILGQLKKFYEMKPQFISYTNDWFSVNNIVAETFTDNIYFNRGVIGGDNNYYQKVIAEMVYQPNKSLEKVGQVQYQMNHDSVLYKQSQKPSFLVSLDAGINPYSACSLSMCCKINLPTLKTRITIMLQQHNQQIGKFEIFKEDVIYDPEIGFKGTLAIERHGSQIKIAGTFSEVLSKLKDLNTKLLKNWKTNIKDWLMHAIADRRQFARKRIIFPQIIEENFDQLSLFELFKPLTYEFKSFYNVEIKWKNKGVVEINKASNFVMSMFERRIKGFLDWFVQNQIVNTSNLKQKPQQPNYHKKDLKQKHTAMFKRINQIVDPNIDYEQLKSWVLGVYDDIHIRVYRMIAVCWILVHHFGCQIKGGFVRDWVVNGEVKLPGGPLNHIIEPCTFTKFYRISDQSYSPSDIDVDLSSQTPFNYEMFVKTINKFGMKVEMKDDGWRYLLAFDVRQPTGGFTVDLIHPYCHISHDKCDFDVNVMYLKGGHLNQIGMKIPLKLRSMNPNTKNQQIDVKMEDLIERCQNKKMRKVITGLDNRRIVKFQGRKWSIDGDIYEPVVHKSMKSTFHVLNSDQLQKFDPVWYKVMVRDNKYTVLEALMIKNFSFEIAYDGTKQWIRKEEKDTNQKRLYHGCSQEAAFNVAKLGFDARYFGSAAGQAFGRGIYFADTPIYSDKYVKANNNGERYMLIVQAALGKQQIMTQPDSNKKGPAVGYHSIKATCREYMQYIFERQGQARPIGLIKYRK